MLLKIRKPGKNAAAHPATRDEYIRHNGLEVTPIATLALGAGGRAVAVHRSVATHEYGKGAKAPGHLFALLVSDEDGILVRPVASTHCRCSHR